MKRFILTAILLLPALLACNKSSDTEREGATSVVLSLEKVDLQVGETATLTATVLPESLGMGVSWSVLDDTYAEVNDGVVTAKAEGVTYVIATSADGYKKAACLVSVNPAVAYTVTINDEMGRSLSAIYGYPGMHMKLSTYTSDGEQHEFTWSIEDPDAGSVDEDGNLTLGAVASEDESFLYDAQSYLKVVSEDGLGTRIPVRSSLLNGIRVDGDYKPKGNIIPVEESSSYVIEVLYMLDENPAMIPADDIRLELSNSIDFSIEKAEGVYSLVTGAVSDVSATLSVIPDGMSEKSVIAEFNIAKTFPVKAYLVTTSSSTLTFTWTEGHGVDDDISKPYTITLYGDEGCTDVVLTYSIPAGHTCWRGRQPRFIFTGLDAGTNYWFKVLDTNGSEPLESDVIPATTDAFTIVEPGDDPAEVGDIILAEDFSELCWMADEVSQGVGYDVGDNNRATFQDRTVDDFNGTSGKYCNPERIITSQETARKASGLRLGKWAQGYTARLYVGPGYVFLSTYGYGTHLITPKLNNIPEDKKAKLEVTIHAAGYQSGYEAVLAVQKGSVSFNALSSGTKTNKDKLDLTTNKATITYTGGFTTLGEFTVTLEGVQNGDRIAFGPTETAVTVSGSAQYVKSNANMMLISDMTVTLVGLEDE